MRCPNRKSLPSKSRPAATGWVFLVCFAATWLGAWVATAEEPSRFRFWREIERTATKEEEILAFALDSEIYAATRDRLPDLRVFDHNHNEAPFQIEPDVEYGERRIRHSAQVQGLALREHDNALEIRFHLPKDSPPAEGLIFLTQQTDYERKIQVFGSDDGTNWTPLVAEGTIFDYSRYMDVSNREIPLPPNRFRQFKVIVSDAADERESAYKQLSRTFRGGQEEERREDILVQRRAFRIDRLEWFWHAVQAHVQTFKRAEYPLLRFEQHTDTTTKQTILQVRTRREPLTGFTLQTTSRNFHRRVTVEVPVSRGPATDWQPIAQASLFRFHFREVQRESLAITFPEHREETYRIVIDNEDNPPLEITGVKAEGNVYRVVFLAEAGKSYRVYYGSEGAMPPKYEAATVLATIRESSPPRIVGLGSPIDNDAFRGEPDVTVRKLLNNWIFLGAVICLMVVVLAWGLVRTGKRIDRLPE